jgi:hypothetical protein
VIETGFWHPSRARRHERGELHHDRRNSSLDCCSQALAAHLDVPMLASDVYRDGAERFAGDCLSARR